MQRRRGWTNVVKRRLVEILDRLGYQKKREEEPIDLAKDGPVLSGSLKRNEVKGQEPSNFVAKISRTHDLGHVLGGMVGGDSDVGAVFLLEGVESLDVLRGLSLLVVEVRDLAVLSSESRHADEGGKKRKKSRRGRVRKGKESIGPIFGLLYRLPSSRTVRGRRTVSFLPNEDRDAVPAGWGEQKGEALDKVLGEACPFLGVPQNGSF